MIRWIFLFFLVLAAVIAGVYGYLGGFRKPEVVLITTKQPVFLAGHYFRGSVRDEAFGSLFRQAQEVREKGLLHGRLANIYYNNSATARDTVQAFIGIMVPDTITRQLPAGFRFRVFGAGQRVLRARITASYLVAPNKLYPALEEAAQAQQLKLRHVYLEQFAEDEPSEVLAVVE